MVASEFKNAEFAGLRAGVAPKSTVKKTGKRDRRGQKVSTGRSSCGGKDVNCTTTLAKRFALGSEKNAFRQRRSFTNATPVDSKCPTGLHPAQSLGKRFFDTRVEAL